MDGTATSDNPTEQGDGVSAYLAQIDRYRLIIEQDGAEVEQNGKAVQPNSNTAEQRRAARRLGMEALRLRVTDAAFTMTEVIAGRLPPERCELFAGIKDPLASLANVSRCIVQIALAEDRFDENAEERASRLAAEAEAALNARRAEEAERADAAHRARKAENRRHVHSSVRAIALSGLDLQWRDREKLLAGLFEELDAHDAFDADPVEIVTDLCVRLGVAIKDPPKQAADHLARRERVVALARLHIEGLRGPQILDAGDTSLFPAAASSAPPVNAQGPP